MFAIPDTLAAIYLTCFLVGLVFVVVSAFLGLSHDLLHAPGVGHGDMGHAGGGTTDAVATDIGHDIGHDLGHDIGHDVGHDIGHGDVAGPDAGGHDAGHADHAGQAASADQPAKGPSTLSLNLMTIMAFLTWFGAAGYILHVVIRFFLPASLVGGLAFGILAGWLVNLFLVKVLLPGTASPDRREFQVVGKLARVSLAIRTGEIGEVVYTMGGVRHSDGARSADGRDIPAGAEVAIVGFERGVAIVEPFERLLPGRSEESRSPQ